MKVDKLKEDLLFWKKEAKNFYFIGHRARQHPRTKGIKSFLLLFFKKEVLSSTCLPPSRLLHRCL
jgi:hypothetical protein